MDSLREAVRERYAAATVAAHQDRASAQVDAGEGFDSSYPEGQPTDLLEATLATSLGCGDHRTMGRVHGRATWHQPRRSIRMV
ncbi:MAG: hypothetical protein ABSG09_01100 [Acidimicrobiales bacterium]